MDTVPALKPRPLIPPRPMPIDRVWFRTRYGQSFPDLLEAEKDEFLDTCIKDVYTMFFGVADLWNHLPYPVYEQKTQLCYGLILAWYITDVYPEYSLGVMSSGGIPLKSKTIGGTKVQFGEFASHAGSNYNADLLQSLKSNAYGAKAYMMIRSSGKINFYIHTRR